MKQEREQEGVLRLCQPAADHYVYAQTGTLVGRNTSVVACKCVRQELSVLNDNKWSGQIGEHVRHQCKELRNQGAAMGFKEEWFVDSGIMSDCRHLGEKSRGALAQSGDVSRRCCCGVGRQRLSEPVVRDRNGRSYWRVVKRKKSSF